jgi:hypothetical protein
MAMFAVELSNYTLLRDAQQIWQALANFINGTFVPEDRLPQYRLAINVDGHGHAYRSSKIFLSGVPMVKVESILQVRRSCQAWSIVCKDKGWTDKVDGDLVCRA